MLKKNQTKQKTEQKTNKKFLFKNKINVCVSVIQISMTTDR